MKLTLLQIENICASSIEAGFSTKFYQKYDSLVGYATMKVLAYTVAVNGENGLTEETSLDEAFAKIDESKMPENTPFLIEMFNRVESAALQEFYSLRASINEVKNFDEEQLIETMKQMKDLQETESETLGRLKELV